MTGKEKTLSEIWERITELCNSDNPKQHAIRMSADADCYYYRRVCVCKSAEHVTIYDTSVDLYRPLSDSEAMQMYSTHIDDFCDKLVIDSAWEKIRNNRYSMQLAIAKGNKKEIEYHYKIASDEVKTLREFLANQQKSS
jgi:hypothetical protein